MTSMVFVTALLVTALFNGTVAAQRRIAPTPRAFPQQPPPAQDRPDDQAPSQGRLVPPSSPVDDDEDEATRDLFFVVSVQLAAAAVGGVVLAPLAWGGPFVAVQTFVSDREILPGAITLFALSLVAIPVFAFLVGVVASVAGAVFGRRVVPGMRAFVAGSAGALTGLLCGGAVAVSLLASLPITAAAVGFWLVGLPMMGVVSAAVGTIAAVYLEGRHAASAPPPPATVSTALRPAGAMRF